MPYSLGRIGPFLSDRILITQTKEGAYSPHSANSCWDWILRVISWVYAPESYTDENRRTIQCFRQMIAPVGEARLQRICTRYGIDLAEMETKGTPLLSRTIAKISVGIEDVKTEDMEEAIRFAEENPSLLPPFFPEELCHVLRSVSAADQLNAKDFASLYAVLGNGANSFPLVPMAEIGGSAPTECWAWLFFDQFLADRERLILQAESPRDTFEVFAHNVAVRIMRRELEVGMLMRAPNSAEGTPQFYRVAAKLITGEGLVSYCFVPATADTDLRSIQFYRGTSTTPSEIDAFSSLLTDLEGQIGQTAWESSKIYRPFLTAVFGGMEIVAGHSLGSTLAQMDCVKNPHIRVAYLFSGPGLSGRKITQFNQRMQRADSEPIHLVINDAARDDLSAMGKVHLGFQSPDKVSITYRQYSGKMHRLKVHTALWHQQKYCGMEGGHNSDEMDAYLSHKTRFSFDWIREAFGSYFGRIFRLARDIFRWVVGSRTPAACGLEIGVYARSGELAQWRTRKFGPRQMTRAMADLYAGTL